MCEQLGLPTEKGEWKGREVLYAGEEGKKILKRFHEASPMDKQLSDLAKKKATSARVVKTILGRRSTFPKQPNGEVWFTHKALNRIIQGSAADMTKQAMVNCHNAGITPLLSVHDELCFSVKDEEQGKQVASYMEEAVPLEIPVVCDVEIGGSWGESME